MFRFAQPLWLVALLLIPALALTAGRRREPAVLHYSNLRLLQGLPGSVRLRLRWIPSALRLAALTLLVLAIARPQTGRASHVVRGKGVDIVMALDISGSMGALDFEPTNRLEAAKQVIHGFIGQRRYDRIGLVVFAREAFSQCPPTIDYAQLGLLLDAIDLAPELGLEDGTAIGLGIAQAATMLQESEALSRVIVLLTDGVNNAGPIDPLTAAQAAAALGIRVYTVGAARPGQVLVPVDDPTLGPTTQWIESEIDEEVLRQIASTADGLYFRAEDTPGLRRIYDQINELEKSDIEVQVFTRYRDLAGWFLLPALALTFVELVLRQTVFRSLP